MGSTHFLLDSDAVVFYLASPRLRLRKMPLVWYVS